MLPVIYPTPILAKILDVLFGVHPRFWNQQREEKHRLNSHEITVFASCTFSELWQVTGRKKRGLPTPPLFAPHLITVALRIFRRC